MSSPHDVSHDPQFKAWAAHIHAHVMPMIIESETVISLVPKGEADVKFAVELGMSIMLDKPIILAVPTGAVVPEHLARVADGIIEIDLDDSDSAAKAQALIAEKLAELGLGEQ